MLIQYKEYILLQLELKSLQSIVFFKLTLNTLSLCVGV